MQCKLLDYILGRIPRIVSKLKMMDLNYFSFLFLFIFLFLDLGLGVSMISHMTVTIHMSQSHRTS